MRLLSQKVRLTWGMLSLCLGVVCGIPAAAGAQDESQVEATTPEIPATSCGCDEPVCHCGDCISDCSQWYASADALFLRRDNSTTDQPIVINGATGETLISSGSLNFDTEPGARFLIGRQFSLDTSVEASYFGLHEWSASRTALGNNDLRLPGDIALATFDFLDADQMRVDYLSEIHSFEANVIRHTDALDLIGGFRYFQLDDDLNIHSVDLQTGASDYNIASRNSLFGGQVGARAIQTWDLLELRGTAKAGLFGADSEQRTFLGDFDNAFVLRNSTTDGGDAAFVGEINLDAIVPLTSIWRLRGGYNLLWVEGIASGPDQLDFTDTPTSGQTLDTNGGVFFYGAHAGLEARW